MNGITYGLILHKLRQTGYYDRPATTLSASTATII